MPRSIAALALLGCLAGPPPPPLQADVPPRPSPARPPAPPAPPAPPVPPVPTVPAVVAVPDPTAAGEAKAVALDFEGLAAGATLPGGLLSLAGRWQLAAETEPKPNGVLRQDQHVPEYAVLLVTGEGRAFLDGKASVRFRPEAGDEDASGGLVFRAKDGENYGLVRANAIEGNFRLYTVRNGFRRQIASLDIEAPRLREWHVLEVSFVGNTFVATLDGGSRIEASSDALGAGWCGLWTKSDSVTSFDDLRIDPVAPKAPEKPATPRTDPPPSK